jgi:two-component system sensor histidine kinase AlgZ
MAAPTGSQVDASPSSRRAAATALGLPPASEVRATGFGTTGFGPTVFDVVNLGAPARPGAGSASVFDVCQAGVVLRALLFVHAVMAIGVAFNAASFRAWLALVGTGSSVALPAVLAWLLIACGLKRPLGQLPFAGQWIAGVGLGALVGAASAMMGWLIMPDLSNGGPEMWLAPALAGAAMAAALFQWLHLRSKASLPAETKARLAELQSRIRPHFLFNTLNTALALVRLDPERAEGVLEDLAELFRVAITDSGESVTLAAEIELARRYLAIEQIRFGDRLHVTWDTEPAAAVARMPPLLLQPLVENAVRHGVEPAAGGGVIRVRTRVKHGRVVITIANSVPEGPARPGNGIALKNVRERLRLMHDVAAHFDARRGPDAFHVQIVVPL